MVNDADSPRADSPVTTKTVTSASDPQLQTPYAIGSRYGVAGSGDRKVCATFSGSGNGLAAQLYIIADGSISGSNNDYYGDIVTGSTSGEYCVTTTGPNTTIIFSAMMLNKSTSTRNDSEWSKWSVTSASDPVPAARAWVTFGGSAPYAGSHIILNTSNFTAGTYKVTLYCNNNGSWQLVGSTANVSVALPANGSVDMYTYGGYGYWFNYPGYQVYAAISGWGNSDQGTR